MTLNSLVAHECFVLSDQVFNQFYDRIVSYVEAVEGIFQSVEGEQLHEIVVYVFCVVL
ncbi:hypothetical protein MBAV_004844 [Candidatus Magnetobacterium bavaricum]|uniref:Uncharacterized protein n=1 Tax=Candidatus Magnetobacterium bavaricum TaxID=29290 RepID=A0A0F3GM45_9BACT|nr:hypothetical protein MBAV_004844 [Candidatus Magnetobacterium bavaricum]